ncbi:MAG: hypothetical protein RL616_1133 [Verrucomicrobiota bacterium]
MLRPSRRHKNKLPLRPPAPMGMTLSNCQPCCSKHAWKSRAAICRVPLMLPCSTHDSPESSRCPTTANAGKDGRVFSAKAGEVMRQEFVSAASREKFAASQPIASSK